MSCIDGKTVEIQSINLEQKLNDSNLRTMALETDNLLDQIGGKIEFGKRVDLFWVVMAVIAAGVLISISLFGKKRKR